MNMSPTTSSKRAIALAAVPLALALTLAGCGSPDGGDSPPGMNREEVPGSASPTVETGGEFNDADAMFVAMVIPHHEQEVEMSEAILAKDGIDERVLTIAEQIRDAEEPEIERMESLLDQWEIDDDAEGDDDDDDDGGWMSEGDLEALEAADGSAAERLYLEGLIEGHEAAVEMAQTEMDEGINPDALEVAQGIIDVYTAELATLQELVAEI
ncbi:DUF305 domain-containing protein [Microbacterium sp. QXD-8]|uniref:DUF305 domain-containing protein n=1 Tax=Microbacterium psychrotolerans TaxID=3068321 RepID=A0ABU0Z6G5_9MICO|nr:DUF305 domain-containing protein [Microbacterium sp. QXD-8]MDQ7880182.1 DUF305 domain-containing protein [Microbacterium sp. QXD-8]